MLALLGCVCFISAQDSWELRGGLSLPQGRFAEDNISRVVSRGDGGAGTGLNLGLKYLSPIEDNLFITGSLDFFYNGFSNDIKKAAERETEKGNTTDITKWSKYISIPVLIGMEYQLPLSSSTNIYGEAGIGANFFKLTKQESEFIENINIDEYNYYYKTNYDSSIKLAGKIGVGLLFNDKYSISLSYWSLGNHNIKGEWTETTFRGGTNTEKVEATKTMDVRILALTAGVRF